MVYSVVVLREGYSELQRDGSCRANSTITLVRGSKNVIVDTGSPWDRDVILQALTKQGLTAEDIDYCVVTHGHPDHCANSSLFTSATHLFGFHLYQKDHYQLHDFKDGIPYEIDEDVSVIATPGHSQDDVSVVVTRTADGTVVIAGDLFEREADLETEALWQDMSADTELQRVHRDKVLQLADVIVPGHGPAFQVKEAYRKAEAIVQVPQ